MLGVATAIATYSERYDRRWKFISCCAHITHGRFVFRVPMCDASYTGLGDSSYSIASNNLGDTTHNIYKLQLQAFFLNVLSERSF